MEKPTYTAIDYNTYENRVIENRIKEYYPRVKALSEERFWGGTKNGVPLRRGVKKLRY